MTYQGLTELYYKYPDAYEAEYERRFNGPFTKHLPFSVCQVGYPMETEM